MYSRSYFKALDRIERQRKGEVVKPRRSRALVDRIMSVVMLCDEILDEQDGVTYDDDPEAVCA